MSLTTDQFWWLGLLLRGCLLCQFMSVLTCCREDLCKHGIPHSSAWVPGCGHDLGVFRCTKFYCTEAVGSSSNTSCRFDHMCKICLLVQVACQQTKWSKQTLSSCPSFWKGSQCIRPTHVLILGLTHRSLQTLERPFKENRSSPANHSHTEE